jgi:nuclear factor related to kappa-B-binding protein
LNPHRPYTFDLHGYKSVVGPVKGVFEKEASSSTKAREHVLLRNDRPAFVTILTLGLFCFFCLMHVITHYFFVVRNAAARLPNGEGTRSDVCELLKDSQYLAPGVTDTQVCIESD